MIKKPTYEDLEKRVKDLEQTIADATYIKPEFDISNRTVMEKNDLLNRLVTSEAKYRELVENLNDGIFTTDANGIITFVSKPIELISGYTSAELVGQNFAVFIHDDDKDTVLRFFTGALQGKISPREYRMKAKDGGYIWVRTSSRPIIEQGQVIGLQGVLTDINERKQTEEKLRVGEETARALLNASTESAFLLDLNGTVVTLNETTSKRLGKQVDELLGKCIYDFLPAHVTSSRKKRLESVAQTGKPDRFVDERSGLIFDQVIYPVFNLQGKVDRVAIFGRDITKEKQVGTELKSKHELLEGVFDAIKDVIGIKHPDHTIIQCNKAGYRL